MKVAKFFVLALMAMATMTVLRAQTNPNSIVGSWESDQKDVRMEYFQDGDHYSARLLWGNKIVETDNATSKTRLQVLWRLRYLSPMNTEQTETFLAILDDDKSVQSALQDLIESARLSRLCFDSAEQFLDSGASHKAACLIADIRMPGMSGIELQARLNAERCRIPIIFVTGRGDIPLAVTAMKEGASDFFTKPVDGTALLNSVERALQRDRVNRLKATESAGLVAQVSVFDTTGEGASAASGAGAIEQTGCL